MTDTIVTTVSEDGLHCLLCENMIIFCECEIVLSKEEEEKIRKSLRELDIEIENARQCHSS